MSRKARSNRARQRFTRGLRRYLRPGRLVALGIAAGIIVGAVFVIQSLSGGAEPGRIIEPVRNERTEGLGVRAEPGQLAPNFEAQDLDGNVMRLSDFQGKAVILNFWATWCTSCRAEIPALAQVYQERKNEGLQVLGIGWGERSVSTASSYMDDLGADYTILMDPDGSIGDAYRLRGLPVTVAIDKDGVIQKIVAGELTYRAFDQLAQLVLGSSATPDDEINPVRDIQTES